MAEFKIIAGFPAYRVNAAGDVQSSHRGDWVAKTHTVGANGYPFVSLWNSGRERKAYVHHLVLETFLGPRPHDHEALHHDGDRRNCRLGNLRWGTRAENIADAIRHGTATIGSRNARAALSRMDVLIMRDMLDTGFRPPELTGFFKVSLDTIRRVARGETYKSEAVHVG